MTETSMPWRAIYEARALSQAFTQHHDDALAVFRETVERDGSRPSIFYFGTALSFDDVDRLSDALACGLQARGFGSGDRLAVHLQNVPYFPIAILAAWKSGGVVVPVNPMNLPTEVADIVNDTEAKFILTSPRAASNLGAVLATMPSVSQILVVSNRELAEAPDDRALPDDGSDDDHLTITSLVDAHTGEVPPRVEVDPAAPAFITFTSGTTGRAKGAINTHRAVAFSAQVYREWMDLDAEDCIFGLAPLTTIAGSIVGFAASIASGASYILTHRFHVGVAIDAIARHKATFLLGPATAIIAMLDEPNATPETLGSLDKLFVGGSPTPAVLVERWRTRFGQEIRTGYGMTEVTGPTSLAPKDGPPVPIDPTSGALAVGIPVFTTDVRIVDDQGQELPRGEVGEVVVRGPQVVPGYWNRTTESEQLFRDGWLLSGDLGKMDDDGWLYVIDRKKDLIITSGFNVIPAEVEEVIYRHPAVHEAAVVGGPDDYRGEQVIAYVSVNAGESITKEELADHCRSSLAAYKCPRLFIILDELPKSSNGKILRRELVGPPKEAPEP